MSVEQLYENHVKAGGRVLSAWFDSEPFRSAWKPVLGLFATDNQRAIAEACAAHGAGLDRDGLLLALKRSGKLSEFPDPEAASDQVLGPYVHDPWEALEELRNAAGVRAMRAQLIDSLRLLDSGITLAEGRVAVADALRAADVSSGAKARTVRQLVAAAFDNATREKRKPGMRTLNRRLDGVTGGIRPGVVWLLAAPTSFGKTSVLCAVTVRGLSEGFRPLIVSAEDAEVLFGQRILQVRSRVNAMRLRDGNLNYEENRLLSSEVQAAEHTPVFLNAIGRPVESVVADIRSICATEGITCVLIDYLQRMRSSVKHQDRRAEVNYVGDACTDAIKQADAGGILFSQLTEGENGKRRARESEDLHNSAEVVLFGVRKREDPKLDKSGKTVGGRELKELWIEKNKDGPAGFSIPLEWDSSAACFLSDYDGPGPEQLGLMGREPVNDFDEFDSYRQ